MIKWARGNEVSARFQRASVIRSGFADTLWAPLELSLLNFFLALVIVYCPSTLDPQWQRDYLTCGVLRPIADHQELLPEVPWIPRTGRITENQSTLQRGRDEIAALRLLALAGSVPGGVYTEWVLNRAIVKASVRGCESS